MEKRCTLYFDFLCGRISLKYQIRPRSNQRIYSWCSNAKPNWLFFFDSKLQMNKKSKKSKIDFVVNIFYPSFLSFLICFPSSNQGHVLGVRFGWNMSIRFMCSFMCVVIWRFGGVGGVGVGGYGDVSYVWRFVFMGLGLAAKRGRQ